MGCEREQKQPSQAEQVLKGEHKLRKMVERTEVNSNISAGFFLFVGAFNAKTKTIISVKFAWEMNDGIYAVSSLPLEKIRIKIDERVAGPTIKFCWKRWNGSNSAKSNISKLMNDYVYYAVVTVRESNWPIQVHLPLNQ